MPVRETRGKQMLGPKPLVIIAQPFHPRLKKRPVKDDPPDPVNSDK